MTALAFASLTFRSPRGSLFAGYVSPSLRGPSSGYVPSSARSSRLGAVDGEAERERERERERDRGLVSRARSGDKVALGELLRNYGPLLFRSVLLTRLGSEAAAHDALAVP